MLTLRSAAFQEGEAIPRRYTGDGEDLSPPLEWSSPPTGTQSLAITCTDPDAPGGLWVHWVLFNLPSQLRHLTEGAPPKGPPSSGAHSGKNDFGKRGYGGPAPPPGKPHRYYFTLYALDATLPLTAGATYAEFLEAIKGHILAEAQVMGVYGRHAVPGRPRNNY